MGGFQYVLDQDARILFVDDDPILREFAKVNLTSDCTILDTAEAVSYTHLTLPTKA